MEIRYISESDDREEISRIYEESWKDAYRGIIPQDFLDSIPKGRWVKNLDYPDWKTLLCIEDSKIIGTCSFCKSRFRQHPDAGEVISLYFLPDYTGKGYGHQLLKAALNELQKNGFSEVFLWVLEENRRARLFYEKHGLLFTGDVIVDSIGGKKLRELRYGYHFLQPDLPQSTHPHCEPDADETCQRPSPGILPEDSPQRTAPL